MSKCKLQISSEYALPATAVTSTIVVYGGKGMGKTNFGAVLMEEFTKCGLRWSFVDPMGVAWGIRHAADGKGAGIECLILGGAHGDIPIEPTGGAVVADLVADHTVNVVIDISRKANGEMWSIGERIRFMHDYGKQLFRRQGSLVGGQRREPICQIIDEVARFIPQVVRSGDVDAAKCTGIWSAIVEEGRNIGLGVVMLTQRSARLNKDVAELADVMLAFRTVGPNSIDAVMDWLGAHIDKARLKEMVQTVRSLPVGSCLAVSPGWLEIEKVVPIRRRETFDSSATPRPGENAVKVRGDGAKPDLAMFAERMKETIERAKADDPKELRKQIAELERSLAASKQAAPAAAGVKHGMTDEEREVIRVLSEQVAALERQAEGDRTRMKAAAGLAKQLADLLAGESVPVQGIAEAQALAKQIVGGKVLPAKSVASRPSVLVPRGRPTPPAGDGVKMGKAARMILTALAQHGVCSRSKLAALTNYSAKGGGFQNALSEARTAGWVAGGEPVEITSDGLIALGSFDPLPRGRELFEMTLSKLSKAEREILRVLDQFTAPLTREEIAQHANYAASGGGFQNALSSLRTRELIQGRDKIQLEPEFAGAIAG